MAVTTDDATFGTPESKIGVTPMMILPAMLRVLPQRKLMETCITGEPINAAQALEMGIVNYVVPRAELDDKVQWLLGRITVDQVEAAIGVHPGRWEKPRRSIGGRLCSTRQRRR